jgi:hypothetical protein
MSSFLLPDAQSRRDVAERTASLAEERTAARREVEQAEGREQAALARVAESEVLAEAAEAARAEVRPSGASLEPPPSPTAGATRLAEHPPGCAHQAEEAARLQSAAALAQRLAEAEAVELAQGDTVTLYCHGLSLTVFP